MRFLKSTVCFILLCVTFSAAAAQNPQWSKIKLLAPPQRQKVIYYLYSKDDTVVLKTPQGKILWTSSGWNLVTDAIIGDDGNFYLTVFDGLLLCLNSQGKKVWSNFMNGSANYVQIVPYGKNGFLVRLDCGGYRERHGDATIADSLQYFQNQTFVWDKNFPAHARIQVKGENIYAVYYRYKKRQMKRIY